MNTSWSYCIVSRIQFYHHDFKYHHFRKAKIKTYSFFTFLSSQHSIQWLCFCYRFRAVEDIVVEKHRRNKILLKLYLVRIFLIQETFEKASPIPDKLKNILPSKYLQLVFFFSKLFNSQQTKEYSLDEQKFLLFSSSFSCPAMFEH